MDAISPICMFERPRAKSAELLKNNPKKRTEEIPSRIPHRIDGVPALTLKINFRVQCKKVIAIVAMAVMIPNTDN